MRPVTASLILALAALPRAAAQGGVTYAHKLGFLAAGSDDHTGPFNFADAQAFCSADDACMGFTFASAAPEPATPVNVYFKTAQNFVAADGWQAYLKEAPAQVPDVNFTVAGLRVGLRPNSHSAMLLAPLDDPMPPHNFSFVPPLAAWGRGARNLPGCHQLGDATLRVQPLAETNATRFALFSSAWAGYARRAAPLPLLPQPAAATRRPYSRRRRCHLGRLRLSRQRLAARCRSQAVGASTPR